MTPVELKVVLLTALLNPAVIAVAFWMGRHADQWQKVPVAAFAGAVVGSVSAGAFPRELRVTPDGRTLILTNFGSRTVQTIDLSRLPPSPNR